MEETQEEKEQRGLTPHGSPVNAVTRATHANAGQLCHMPHDMEAKLPSPMPIPAPSNSSHKELGWFGLFHAGAM